jgi:hypothetical protein
MWSLEMPLHIIPARKHLFTSLMRALESPLGEMPHVNCQVSLKIGLEKKSKLFVFTVCFWTLISTIVFAVHMFTCS